MQQGQRRRRRRRGRGESQRGRTTWRGGDGWLGEDDLKPAVETAVELAGAAATGRGRKGNLQRGEEGESRDCCY
jgi:hypothetical protein